MNLKLWEAQRNVPSSSGKAGTREQVAPTGKGTNQVSTEAIGTILDTRNWYGRMKVLP
jgi:hypothetical protein